MAFKFPTLAEDDYLREINRGADTSLQQQRAGNAVAEEGIRRQGDFWSDTLKGSFDAYHKAEERDQKAAEMAHRREMEDAAEARALAEEQRNTERFGREAEKYDREKGKWGAEDEALGMELEAKKRAAAAAKRKEAYELAPTKDGKTREVEMWEVGDEGAKLGNTKTKAEIGKLNAEAGAAAAKKSAPNLDMAKIEAGIVAQEPDPEKRAFKTEALANKYGIDAKQAAGLVLEHDKTPENTAKFRAEYDAKETTKRTAAVVENYNRIQEVAKNPETMTGPDDMALIYSFVKMNDPTSTVNSGEQATAKNAGGISEELMNTYNAVANGAVLSPNTRRKFIEGAKNLARAQLKSQAEVDNRYREISKGSGVPSEMVINSTYGRMAQDFETPPKTITDAPTTPSPPPQDGEAQAATPKTYEEKKAYEAELLKRKAARGGK